MKKLNFFITVISTMILNVSASSANDCPFYIYGQCYDCNSTYALKVGTQDACEKKCPNRIYLAQDRTCRLKIGEQISFPTHEDTSISSDYCETETINLGTPLHPDYITVNKGDPKDIQTDKYKAAKSGIYFNGKNNKCYKCDTTEPVSVSSSCDGYFCHSSCNDRMEKHHNSAENLYSVMKCPKDRPLMDRFMMCWSYDEENPLDLSYDTSFNNANIRTMNGPFSYKK